MQLPDVESLNALHKEWFAVKAAPWSFAVCVTFFAVLEWAILYLIFRNRLERYKEAVEHLERDKERLKEQLAERPADS